MANALVRETSPYLLQHAHNPVDWLPWGEEAFARAKREDRMVFLSVGYSTCHWCHVMERESFESESIAALMNESFVCVKVDREERPDLDAVYMAFVQATTGQGGWPMSVWLTPEGKPVAGGTYFPPEDRHGRAGFPKWCRELARLWREDRGRMEESAAKVTEYLREQARASGKAEGMPGEGVFGDFLDEAERRFDAEFGGWGGAPKFPRPAVPMALMAAGDRLGGDERESAMQMVERTARAMAAGGLHDPLGGGFHRYSVDRYWHVPHYEKMLYDQAQLVQMYTELWARTGEAGFAEAVEKTIRYVIDEMTDRSGGFHAAEDADSLPEEGAKEKLEGAYWTWTAAEVVEKLGTRDGMIFAEAYGIQEGGNARPESDPHGELEGRNTLYRAASAERLAERFGMAEGEIVEVLESAEKLLLGERAKRPKPHRDDKVVAAWNGMMAEALLGAARVFGREEWRVAADRCLEMMRQHLWDGERLRRSWRGRAGEAAGFPADYASVLLALQERRGHPGGGVWEEWENRLLEALDRDYWEGSRAGYVMRPKLGDEVLMEIREDYDGAEPAANHQMMVYLLRRAALEPEGGWKARAESMLAEGAKVLQAQPFAVPLMLEALDLWQRGAVKIEWGDGVEARLRDRAAKAAGRRWVRQWAEGLEEVVVCVEDRCLAPVREAEEWERVEAQVAGKR